MIGFTSCLLKLVSCDTLFFTSQFDFVFTLGVSFPVPTSCKDASDMGYTTTGYYVIDNDDFSGPLGLLLGELVTL